MSSESKGTAAGSINEPEFWLGVFGWIVLTLALFGALYYLFVVRREKKTVQNNKQQQSEREKSPPELQKSSPEQIVNCDRDCVSGCFQKILLRVHQTHLTNR